MLTALLLLTLTPEPSLYEAAQAKAPVILAYDATPEEFEAVESKPLILAKGN